MTPTKSMNIPQMQQTLKIYNSPTTPTTKPSPATKDKHTFSGYKQHTLPLSPSKLAKWEEEQQDIGCAVSFFHSLSHTLSLLVHRRFVVFAALRFVSRSSIFVFLRFPISLSRLLPLSLFSFLLFFLDFNPRLFVVLIECGIHHVAHSKLGFDRFLKFKG